MNRRTLISTSTATLLTAASYRRVMGANGRVNLFLIGSGSRGREVTGAFLKTGRVNLVGLCDAYDLRRQDARKQLLPLGAPTAFDTVSIEDALSHKDVDAAVVATPDHLHMDHALAVLGAKKHLYVEKPTTHHIEEGDKLVAAVKMSGKVCQTGTQQRSGAHYIRAKKNIFEKGRLGKVLFARAVWCNFPKQTRTFDATPKPAELNWERFLGRWPIF